jgi:hypothetical protein
MNMEQLRISIMGAFHNSSSMLKRVSIKSYLIFAMLILAFTIRLFYLSYTSYDTRAHDVLGHIQYFEYIAANLALPSVNFSDQTYHPPVYYIISAIFYDFFSFFHLSHDAIYKNIQFLSLCYFMGFLIAGTLIIVRYIRNNSILLLCLSLFYFWPSTIIHSVRIGNDVLFYFFFCLSLYFLFKWYDENNKKDVSFFTLFALLSIFTKANGIILFGIFAILALIQFIHSREKAKLILSILPSMMILCIGILATVSIPFLEALKANASIPFFKRGEGLPSQLFVGNEVKNYVYFDIKTFINEPFTSPWDDQMGRQYFWNYLLKSGLFGEFSFDQPFLRNIAMIISFLFLIIIGFSLFGIASLKKHELTKYAPFALVSLIMCVFAILFRIYAPASCSNDFRYILPVIIVVPIFIDKAFTYLKEKKLVLINFAGYLSILGFVVCSIVFFLVLR